MNIRPARDLFVSHPRIVPLLAGDQIGVHDGLPLFLARIDSADRKNPHHLTVRFDCSCGRRHWHSYHAFEDIVDIPQHRGRHCHSHNPRAVGVEGYFFVVTAEELSRWMGDSR